ncbi:MAG: VOC family protein [Phycisphaerales bacterium]|nr:VOC family protein [Phycisphaerales bacterium]
MGKPIIHFEIGCRDLTKTTDFYSKLLDWKTTPYGPSQMIDTGTQTGIMGHFSAMGHEPHNYCLIYAQVEDINAALKKANELGATTVVPPTEVPTMGHFAWIKDPEGTLFGLWKPMQG